MDALFGKNRAALLRANLPNLRPDLRESAILEAMANELKGLGGKYVLPFTFRNATGTRTTHKLIFVSKNFRGYDIMKDIMARESSTEDEGVPSFTYSPADASMPLLFSLAQPRSKLKADLLRTFAGEELNLKTLYERHSVDKPFIRKNYRETLIELEKENMVSVRSEKEKRLKSTYPEHVLIKFPERRSNGD